MADDESTLLAEEVGRLREVAKAKDAEIRQLVADVGRAERKARSAWGIAWVKNALLVIPLALGLLAVIVGAFYSIWMAFTSPSEPEFCVIRKVAGCACKYTLTGAVPWGEDITYGTYQTYDEAKKEAAQLGCPLR